MIRYTQDNEIDHDVVSHPVDEFIRRANLRNVPPAVLICHMSDQVDRSPAFLCNILQRDAS